LLTLRLVTFQQLMMVLTRLLNLSTMSLEEFDVDQMPAYHAISHVWTDELFPRSSLHKEGVSMSAGLQMVQAVRKKDTGLCKIPYCWIDTWCIDQNDPEDKNRQIPVMGKIYKNATLVIVAVRHRFSFCQGDWDALRVCMQPAIDQIEDIASRFTPATRKMINSRRVSRSLKKAIRIIRELNDLTWMKRVWTAQEYILARRVVYLGTDLRPLRFSAVDINRMLTIFSWGTDSDLLQFANIWTTNHIRTGTSPHTLAMGSATHREAKFIEDEVYGLMAASEVVIKPLRNAQVEEIWRAWWEQSIREGHLLWMMLPLYHTEAEQNCVMPSFKDRHRSLAIGHVCSTVLLGPVELQEGSITLSGYFAGICTIVAHLGLEENESKIIAAENGNIDIGGSYVLLFRRAAILSQKRKNFHNGYVHTITGKPKGRRYTNTIRNTEVLSDALVAQRR
jgi:hypothetical protein